MKINIKTKITATFFVLTPPGRKKEKKEEKEIDGFVRITPAQNIAEYKTLLRRAGKDSKPGRLDR